MAFIRSCPGRVRFFVQKEANLKALCAQMHASFEGAEKLFQLTYNPRTQRALCLFDEDEALTARFVAFLKEHSSLLEGALLSTFEGEDCSFASTMLKPAEDYEHEAKTLPHPFVSIAKKLTFFTLRRLFMPMAIRPFWVMYEVTPLIKEGFNSLRQKKLDVHVLDAAAIGSSILMGDFATAGMINLLLGISEILEDWTKERSKMDLLALFEGEKENVWILREGVEISVHPDNLVEGDLVVVNAGGRIPVDGTVLEGLAMVNEASMTGEGLPVRKKAGSEVFAGTALEEGRLVINTDAVGSATRFGKVAKVLIDSEEMKANIQSQAGMLADKIVPFSFLLSALILVVTRDPRKAATVLLADYSCAIKLATPLAVRSAMLESGKRGALIKGGKYLESLAKLDAVVLDKTGTLTESRPELVKICPVNGYSEDFVLRQAACMEEHFPHPIAESIVRKAEEKGLSHKEEHTTVEYILAHGIATTLNGERMVLGSRHFVHEDEGISLEGAEEAIASCTQAGQSLLYLACGDKIAGILVIKDPLREDAFDFIRQLEDLRMRRIVMLTGDSESTAKLVAEELGIDEFYAQVLPDEKLQVIERVKSEGHTVAMIGDGINDSAALRYADVGVSLQHGAAIAKEVCDLVLTDNNLESFIDSVSISKRAMRRIQRNFSLIVLFNTAFMGLGLFGLISPALMAGLHNLTTVGICAFSMRPVLPKSD